MCFIEEAYQATTMGSLVTGCINLQNYYNTDDQSSNVIMIFFGQNCTFCTEFQS